MNPPVYSEYGVFQCGICGMLIKDEDIPCSFCGNDCLMVVPEDLSDFKIKINEKGVAVGN